jgi:hypothetical protein
MTWFGNELVSRRVLDRKGRYQSTIKAIWLHGGTCRTTTTWVDNELASGRVLSWKSEIHESY